VQLQQVFSPSETGFNGRFVPQQFTGAHVRVGAIATEARYQRDVHLSLNFRHDLATKQVTAGAGAVFGTIV
jgi:hypothetical protein